MNGTVPSRRTFLCGAGAFALSRRALAGANERINAGFIGVGGMGMGRLREFMNQPDVNVTAICDADGTHVARAVEAVRSKQGAAPQAFADFRKLLDVKDVDAVVIATPDHWHALTTVEACRAGKDVFVEKPLCHSIYEGRAMVEAARRHERVTQMGNHIHNDHQNFRRVVEVVRSGMLGDIRRVYCWIRSNREGIGNPPDSAPPAELDYDLWLGPAPKRTYNGNRSHRSFRYFWDYSGGVFIDFWCHITDVAWWALDLKAPKSVAATGGRYVEGDDNGETPNVMEAVYDFPGMVLSWNVNTRGIPGFESRSIGCAFQGSQATLVTGYSDHEIWVEGKLEPRFKRPEPSIPDSPGHIREFLDAVKSRAKTSCSVEYGHRLSKGGLLGNLAYRTGRRIHWDDAREAVVSDREAQRLAERRYRKPWKLS